MSVRLLLLPVVLVTGLALAGCGGSSETTTVTVTTSVTSTSTTTAQSPAVTAAIVELQTVMSNLGYYTGPIDGVYGDATTEGVKKMQTDLGVTADGVFGQETYNALKAKGTSIVASLQTALQTYGYYTGEITGAYDQATADAVSALQKDLGVAVDGKFGSETAQAAQQAVADGTLTPKPS